MVMVNLNQVKIVNKPWSSHLPPFGIIEKRTTRANKKNMMFAIITTGVMEKNNLQNTQGGMKDIDHASHKKKINIKNRCNQKQNHQGLA